MATTRITRLTRIASFRAFQNWSDDGVSETFKRVNVIYGVNGSGKSTLAHLMRAAADGDLDEGIALEFAATSGSRSVQIRADSNEFWQCVRVFNDKYVTENLRFDDITGPSPDSLLTLGVVNVTNETELEEAKARREAAREERQRAEADFQSSTRALDRRLSTAAAEIVQDLSGSGVPRYRATNVYNKSHIVSRLRAFDSASTDGTTNTADDLKLALSPSPERLIVPAQIPVEGPSLVERTANLLGRSVTSIVLDELHGEPGRARWVQEGLHLHEKHDTCLFCGGLITEQRRKDLAEHFDDALTQLQRDIDILLADIQRSVELVSAFEQSSSGLTSSYPDLQDNLRSAIDDYGTSAETYRGVAESMDSLLREKRSNPFSPTWLVPGVDLSPPATAPLVEPLVEHNERAAKHSQLVDEASQRVEMAKVRIFKPEHEELTSRVEETGQLVQTLDEEIRTLTARIITLENVETDPVPKADELTKHVARLLGRTDLEFEMNESTSRYVIKRNGSPATHLSEGERTAIALLHFLVGVRADSNAGDPPVIVIDDPVSSLDDSILFGVSSYLWAELVISNYASQVFLLTHKFELFRQWVIQIEGARPHIDGEASIHEIRMRYEIDREDNAVRVPRFTPWTTDKKLSKRLRSQYHFLFARVASALVDAKADLGLAERMELLSLVPNAARKMIEGFLSFRYPEHIGNFHGGMRAALSSVDDAALRTRVERYLHAYSHNEEGDISAVVDPSEVGPVIQSLFELMKEVDARHFNSMCTALEIDASVITS